MALTGNELIEVRGVTSTSAPSGGTFTVTTDELANLTGLTGNETLEVQGVTNSGLPSGQTFITTAEAISTLSGLTGDETLEVTGQFSDDFPCGQTFLTTTGEISALGGASLMAQPVGNRNVLAYTTSTSSSRVRPFRMKIRVAKNADWSSIKLTFANFLATSTNESVNVPILRIQASMQYEGTFYPVTFSAASYYILGAGLTIESDAVDGLALTADTEAEVCGCYFLPLLFDGQTGNFTVGETVTGGTSGATGVIVSQTDAGASGSLVLHTETGTFQDNEAITDPITGAALVNIAAQTIALSMTTVDVWLEGVLNSQNSALTYLTSNPVTTRASYTATVVGGSITACVKVSGGSGYTGGCSAVAWEYIDGILWKKTIGNGNLSGGTQNSVTVTAGTPPAGLAAWIAPNITMAGGGDFGSTTAIMPPALITGIPSVGVKSLLIMGDSVDRGYSSTDALGDIYHNFGFQERALQNRCGVINMGISSLTASALANHASTYPLTYALYMGKCTHARLGIGINDITTGRTKVQLEANQNTIAAYVRTFGTRLSYRKFMPGTTSSDSFATEVNQTPRTGCAAGGVLDLVNADIDSGVLVSDGANCDPYAVARGIDPNVWGVVIADTNDGLHWSAYTGIANVSLNDEIIASFDQYA